MSDTAPAAAPIETLKETHLGLDLAVIAFTKGCLSPEELWAECDWAATSYERHGVKDARKTVFARYAELIAE